MAASGRKPKMSDDELVELVRTSDDWAGRPFTTAPELADRVGMSRQGVHRRLQTLVKEGRIEKYKSGQSAVYWSVADSVADS
jgi:DNA-binding IclR family transcriptional regulator